MNRRDFLGNGVRLAATGAVSRHVIHLKEPLPSPFLDAHVHPASAALREYTRTRFGGSARADAVATGAALVERMDNDGVHRAFALSTAYQMASDYKRAAPPSESEEHARVASENDFAAEQCALFPDRLVPFLSLNPKRTYAIDEIDRCVEVRKMRGLKLHFWNSMLDTRKEADLSAIIRVVSHAAKRGLPVVAHIFVGDVLAYGPDDTERFVREVIAPIGALKISIAHLAGAGGFGPRQQDCFAQLTTSCGPGTALAARVWTDMAAVLSEETSEADVAAFAALVPRWGADRLFWGSDSSVDALAAARDRWPITIATWRTVANNRGADFCK
jgi:predicted TIM-barrel fold metal-dependent hydrolase